MDASWTVVYYNYDKSSHGSEVGQAAIRPAKLDLLFLISQFQDLGVGVQSLFIIDFTIQQDIEAMHMRRTTHIAIKLMGMSQS